MFSTFTQFTNLWRLMPILLSVDQLQRVYMRFLVSSFSILSFDLRSQHRFYRNDLPCCFTSNFWCCLHTFWTFASQTLWIYFTVVDKYSWFVFSFPPAPLLLFTLSVFIKVGRILGSEKAEDLVKPMYCRILEVCISCFIWKRRFLHPLFFLFRNIFKFFLCCSRFGYIDLHHRHIFHGLILSSLRHFVLFSFFFHRMWMMISSILLFYIWVILLMFFAQNLDNHFLALSLVIWSSLNLSLLEVCFILMMCRRWRFY